MVETKGDPDQVGSYNFQKKKRLRPGTAVYRSEPFQKTYSGKSVGHADSAKTTDIMNKAL